jgi:transcriptional regulator with XRE-family HTH domain
MTEKEIFETVKATSVEDGFTQQEMAKHLECSQGAVSRMLAGESKFLSLAVKWVEMRIPVLDWEIETDDEGKPVRYYKAVSSNYAENKLLPDSEGEFMRNQNSPLRI